MTRAAIKDAQVRELIYWWRNEGWTPETAKEITRYWPDGAFGPSDIRCGYEGCGNDFPADDLYPHKRYCSDRCKKLQGQHVARTRGLAA